MKEFDSIIIGFGKAGKTLAGFQAKAGEKVALIEASSQMYGGTCINVGCIPSKTLETQARLSASIGGSWEEKARRYAAARIDETDASALPILGAPAWVFLTSRLSALSSTKLRASEANGNK